MKWLIAGLGNPEGKYFQTYHNVGFLVADEIAKKSGAEFRKKGNQMVADAPNALILKPLTYMNLSGQAVVAVMRKRGILPENVIVICDDLAIDKGNIRVAFGGSSGGHNGLKSVTELTQTDKYIRVRVGIAPPKTIKGNTANYVLSRIDGESQPLLDQAIDKAVAAVTAIISGEPLPKIQGAYNVKNSQ